MIAQVARWLTVAIVLVLGAASVQAQEKVELRWRFKKDQVLQYVFKQRDVRTTTLGTQDFEQTTEMEYDLQWTVQDIDDQGVATLEQKITGLRVRILRTDFEFNYDSARANQANENYRKKLVNFYDQLRFGSYQLKVRPDGSIVQAAGLDKLLEEAVSDSNITDYLLLNLHDDSFVWHLQQVLGTLPAKAVAAESGWKAPADAKWPNFGQLIGDSRFTLGKPVKIGESDCREIGFTGQHALELDMKWLNIPLRGVLKTSKMSGTIRFDPREGRVYSSEVESAVSGDLKIGSGDNPGVLKLKFQFSLALEPKVS